jgi:hypothetical protein
MSNNPLLDNNNFRNENPLKSFDNQRHLSNSFQNEDTAPLWIKIVSFLFPIVGFIIWLTVDKAQYPNKAKETIIWAGIGVALWAVYQLSRNS